jgi:hypothetical protein
VPLGNASKNRRTTEEQEADRTMKKLGLISALWALFCCPAIGSGTIPFSLSQQLDEFGNPLAGCFLYLIQAGTVSTPQNGYQDSALTIVTPNPLRCDAAGRIGQFFLADGSIKVRLTKSTGVDVLTADGILVIGPSGGGGGGGSTDPSTVLTTGDIKTRYGTAILSGFVRMNGRTIGSASSGATERANADAQPLFEYLWNNDANLAVSGGRGVSSINDWNANKTITLPDMRGRGLVSLADMGNAAANLTTASCATPTVLGTACGTETKTLAQTNMPNYNLPSTLSISNTLGISDTHAISDTLGLNDPGHTHSVPSGATAGGGNITAGGLASFTNGQTTGSNTTGITRTGGVSLTGSVSLTGGLSLIGSVPSGGSQTPISVLSPSMLITTYIKL